MSDTLPNRPIPRRPEYGLLAWEATLGYISQHYSPDANLTIRAAASDNGIFWAGEIVWGQNAEAVHSQPSINAALEQLWWEVNATHIIFKAPEDAAARIPAYYKEWLNKETNDMLKAVLSAASASFGSEWSLVLHYQPIEDAHTRMQARLIARNQDVLVSGRGPSLLDACYSLYRSAVHTFNIKE